jgi:hypothetical protein
VIASAAKQSGAFACHCFIERLEALGCFVGAALLLAMTGAVADG